MPAVKHLKAHWLLLAALLLTQALGVAHALDHPALGHADHACAVCVHGQGLDHVPPTVIAIAPPLAAATSFATHTRPPHDHTPQTGYLSRAPPVLA